MYNILWSCLSTIFACSWIAVHPNIPAPGDSRWAVLGRRVAIMGYILLTPEFVIFWGGRQHYAARNFLKKHEKKHTGWTRTHTFFLIMGGFTLHEGGRLVRVLEAEELEILSEAGKIKWPTITEDSEITDRSKGDYLSKTIVLSQATWFIIQCIARGAYGLVLTELEVVTVAFASLTGVIYYLWWDKPLDVRCSTPVHLLEGSLGNIEGDIKKEHTGSRIIPFPKGSDQEILEKAENVVINTNTLPSIPIQVGTSTPNPALINTGSNIVPEFSDQGIVQGDEVVIRHPNPLPLTPLQDDTSPPDPAFTRVQRFQAKLFELGYIFIVFPLERFVVAIFDMLDCSTLGDQNFRVPTFYSSPNEPSDLSVIGVLGVCVSIFFGAIHCIGWSFHFVTLQEQWEWRMSAILVSGVPIFLTTLSGITIVLKVKPPTSSSGLGLYHYFLLFISFAMVCIYIIARITLLVLPFIALRSLPPNAYIQFNWVDFLPHI